MELTLYSNFPQTSQQHAGTVICAMYGPCARAPVSDWPGEGWSGQGRSPGPWSKTKPGLLKCKCRAPKGVLLVQYCSAVLNAVLPTQNGKSFAILTQCFRIFSARCARVAFSKGSCIKGIILLLSLQSCQYTVSY